MQSQLASNQTVLPAGLRRPELPGLTSIRAFAALLVFLCHLRLGSEVLYLKPFDYGYMGVSLFFILSGFILTWSYRAGSSRSSFYWRRFARVYPCHLTMFLIVAIALLVVGNGESSGWVYAFNVSLTQAWSTDPAIAFSLNDVSWSLSCEAVFYLAFPVIFVAAGRLGLRTVWLSVALAFAGYLSLALYVSISGQGSDLVLFVYTNPAVRMAQFLIGVAVARTVIAGRKVPLWIAVGALSFAGIGAMVAPHQPAPDAWITPLAAAIIALLTAEK